MLSLFFPPKAVVFSSPTRSSPKPGQEGDPIARDADRGPSIAALAQAGKSS